MTREEQQIDEACTNWICSQEDGTVIMARNVWRAAVEWAYSHPHWISVEDELPKFGEPVFFFTPSMDEPLKGAYQENGTWWSVEYECKFINGVTHWMEIQPPRKEEEL